MFDLAHAPEALSTEKYDFEIEKQPLFTRSPDGDMMMVDSDIQQAVVREDTGQVLATVGPRYEITRHKDAFDAISQALLESGMDLTGMEVRDGLYENGSRARRTIIIPQIHVEPAVGDRMHFKLDAFNSVDGRWAFRNEFGYYRLACLNGMVTAEFAAGIYAKHTSVIDVEAISKRLQTALEMVEKDEATFAAWTKIKVSEAQAGWFFAQTLAKVARRGMEDDVNKTLHARLMSRFNAERATVYGLWNAMTAWSSHEPIPRGAEHNVRLNREQAVARAMGSRQFGEIIDGVVDEHGNVTLAA